MFYLMFYHRKLNYIEEMKCNNAKLYLHGQFYIFSIYCPSFSVLCTRTSIKYSHKILLAGRETGKMEEEPTKLHQAFLMPQRDSDSNRTVIERSELKNGGKKRKLQTKKKKQTKKKRKTGHNKKRFKKKGK